ncbi:hypothetical protein CLU79DRAFT_776795 [Phycomyces nitens]|nr:hypothetical protein CLU79DRAFT_776795 [Phycomyces nitens]
MWISSNEDNAVVFDITYNGLDAGQFFQTLKSQYPSVVVVLGQDRMDRNITLVPFVNIEDVPRACSYGVVVGHRTLLVTPTFGGNINILHVHLDKLPLCRADKLEPHVQKVMGLFGRGFILGCIWIPSFNCLETKVLACKTLLQGKKLAILPYHIRLTFVGNERFIPSDM